ncbi:MAG TPA: glyoxalase [Cytophagales bacterium]|nr:glyoxalase [Cytophagales bacterium]HAA20937.1 glyoxalase [Cytophagales bacterium]HAP60782.1 glyoxalase [Cytophagales bacterium]
MPNPIRSVRAFVGAKDYDLSRKFYKAWGWEEIPLPPKMSYFRQGAFGFYLQDYYVKDWVDNTMLFLEVEHLASYRDDLLALKLTEQFPTARISPNIVENDWGNEFFVHDPAGVLWHIGEFAK